MLSEKALQIIWIICAAIFIKLNIHLDENFGNGQQLLIKDCWKEIWNRINSPSGPWSALIIWLAYRCWRFQKLSEVGYYYLKEIIDYEANVSNAPKVLKYDPKLSEYVSDCVDHAYQNVRLGPPISVIEPKDLLSKVNEESTLLVNGDGTVSIYNKDDMHEIIQEDLLLKTISESKLSCTEREMTIVRELAKLDDIYTKLIELCQNLKLQNARIENLVLQQRKCDQF